MASTQELTECILNILYLILIKSSSPASTIKTIEHDLHCYHFMVTMQSSEKQQVGALYIEAILFMNKD